MSGQIGMEPDWPAPARLRAYVSGRAGGVSAGGYASLNLGTRVGDQPHCVADNRRRLREALALPAEPAWLEQVHGREVVDLDRDAGRRGDGAVTARAGVVCAVLTADCLPVLLCDRAGTRVGVAHAGWRGLAAGVLEAAVQAMQCAPAELLAWLGPAIGPHRYEVGDDVRAAFGAADAEAAFAPNRRGRWQADLCVLARRALGRAGVTAVHGGGLCTYMDAVRFFSHRREAPCGRFATLVWLER